MLQGTGKLEVLREIVFPVDTKHRLALLREVALAFERYVDRGTSIDDALVQNAHLASVIVYGIVGTFGKGHTTCSNNHRTLWHIHCSKRDYVGRCTTILSHEHVFVLLCNLVCHGLCRIIKFGKGIFVCLCRSHTFGYQIILQIATKRLGCREEYTTIANGVAFYIVEISVRVSLVVVIQAVGTKHLDKCLVFNLRLWNISNVYTCGIALELHIQAELLFLYRRSQGIHVFHHQVPVALMRVVACILQRFHKQCFVYISIV